MPVTLVTGTSTGIGFATALHLARHGHRVVATMRNLAKAGPLEEAARAERLPLTVRELDVTREDSIDGAVAATRDAEGAIDVLVNNAGIGGASPLELTPEPEHRAMFEANFFGALWITQAALPCLRAQGGGHILQVSSIGGISAFPNVGIYNASKWALEGLSQALAAEVAAFGVRVTIIEPGAYATDWAGASGRRSAPLSDYAAVREEAARQRAARASAPGDPAATRSAILQVVDADDFGDLGVADVNRDLGGIGTGGVGGLGGALGLGKGSGVVSHRDRGGLLGLGQGKSVSYKRGNGRAGPGWPRG
jgi:NAD(P)-dependent dehydrogenase (short-subunit alcohol dehydrogenase family)